MNSADRCTWAGGRGRFEAFNERGGRWLQVVVRECAGPVVIHRVAIRQKTIPLPETGSYECSDPVLTGPSRWRRDAACKPGRRLDRSLARTGHVPRRRAGGGGGDAVVHRGHSIERWAVRLWAQAQMLQSHKMAALGRLVDGVAHELSDPISFIWGNLAHLEGYGQQLLALVAAYETCCPQPPSQVKQLAAAVDLSYLQADLPKTLASIRSGAARIKRLGASLQNFCHIDEVYPKPASLHDLLDSVLLLLMSRLDTSIHIVRQYGRLPPVSCFAGQLAQVLMNILSNAVDTLLEQTIRCTLAAEFSQPISAQADYLPTLTLRTWLCSSPVQCLEDGDRRWVVLQISDNGPGLSPEIEQQVQQGFAEEKRMMKETSLAISYHIITGRHGGQFYVRSQTFTQEKPPADVGSQFEIWLPLA
ncbi:MAG: HAMP domain-containing histidine kinase [Leptolyngbyaceae cyanobacterium RM2_2_21]|nr:HAMP domain-containing histidine kinase [Leptolyngbyaceae cyanobacterium RM2_2_21]